MKLVVLAQTPPPLHGQSAMVQLLVERLPDQGVDVHHVNLRLSRTAAAIGRWEWAKIRETLRCCFRVVLVQRRTGCRTLYYVPAPAKRGALYRDWAVMLICRPFFRHLVLHWHAVGLGEWLHTRATRLERLITRWLLGRASLSLVLAPALQADAERLSPRSLAIVPNGVPDPGPPAPRPSSDSFGVLFIGEGSEAKGLFRAAQAVLEANQRLAGDRQRPAMTLTAAGPFASDAARQCFVDLVQQHPGVLCHVGRVGGDAKSALFRASHVLCLPTTYAAEGLPLVVLEALAHDRPVVATAWRGLVGVVDTTIGRTVPVGDPGALVGALLAIREHPPAPGVCRARYLECYTSARHLALLAANLRALD